MPAGATFYENPRLGLGLSTHLQWKRGDTSATNEQKAKITELALPDSAMQI